MHRWEDERRGGREEQRGERERFEDRDERSYRGQGGFSTSEFLEDPWRDERRGRFLDERMARGGMPERYGEREQRPEDLGRYEQQRWSPGRHASEYGGMPGRGYNPTGGYGSGQQFQGYEEREREQRYGEPQRYRGRFGESRWGDEERWQQQGYGGERYGQQGMQRSFEQEPYGRQGYGSPYEQQRFGSQYGQQGYGSSYGQQGYGQGWGAQRMGMMGPGQMLRQRRMSRGPKGYKRSDDRIREDVCDRLSDAIELDASELEVSVSNGEVTLTGTIPERTMKYEAEQIAESVSGVTEIHNQLRVKRAESGMGMSEPTQDRPSMSRGTPQGRS